MTEKAFRGSTGRKPTTRNAAAPVIGLVLALAAAPTPAEVDPEADQILRSMSTYLGGLSALRVEADVDNEIIDLEGRKLQFSSSVKLNLQRPGKLHVARSGPFAESELFFDGETVTLSVAEPAVHAQFPAPGNIEQAIAAVRSETGLDAPAGDLLYSDPYAGLLTDVVSGTYNGTAFVQDVECHHLAFRAAKVDWQIWIQAGDTPLPMKYVITSKWVTGAPQYSVRFRGWEKNPEIDAARFLFTAPEGSTRIDAIPVNEMGELMLEEDR
jgi:hypothetical protein